MCKSRCAVCKSRRAQAELALLLVRAKRRAAWCREKLTGPEAQAALELRQVRRVGRASDPPPMCKCEDAEACEAGGQLALC